MVKRAFAKLGDNVTEVNPDNLAGAAAARWLALSPEARANAGLMAPSHAIRERINEIVRERLVRDGTVHGPAMATERLVSKSYTNAEKTLAANYRAGDVVAFHRPYKRLGVEKGDELRVAGVDNKARAVMLEGKDGQSVAWEPNRLAARSGGVEVYGREDIELRAGNRIRWTRNDDGLGLVNSQTAEVAGVAGGKVTFRLGDGRMLDLAPGDPQLRHIDRALASTVHAFQGRTVDTVIAANHPNLTNLKTLYVEISRARDRAELVTDDKAALRETLEAVTGERIAALEAVEPERATGRAAVVDGLLLEGDKAREEFQRMSEQANANTVNIAYDLPTECRDDGRFVQKIFPYIARQSEDELRRRPNAEAQEIDHKGLLTRTSFPVGSAGFLVLQARALMSGVEQLPWRLSVVPFSEVDTRDDPNAREKELVKRLGCTMSIAMNSAFSCELSMKAICLTRTDRARMNHDLAAR